jgi:hypothetical protein
MKTSIKNAVSAVTAVTVATKPLVYSRDYVLSQAADGIKHDAAAKACKLNCMRMLVAEFGEHAVRPYDGGKGGINCNSFKTNSSLDTMQLEAGRLDMSLVKAKELAGIIAEIRALGERVWQEFQRVMFGRNDLVLTSVPVTSIAGEALVLALTEKTVASNAKKVAKAQLDIAKVQGGDVVSAQTAFDTATQSAIVAKENVEHARHAAKIEVDKKNVTKAIDKLEDAIQIAIEVATKLGRDAIADKLTKILALV